MPCECFSRQTLNTATNALVHPSATWFALALKKCTKKRPVIVTGRFFHNNRLKTGFSSHAKRRIPHSHSHAAGFLPPRWRQFQPNRCAKMGSRLFHGLSSPAKSAFLPPLPRPCWPLHCSAPHSKRNANCWRCIRGWVKTNCLWASLQSAASFVPIAP